MRILIAEDDLASRKFLFKLLSNYGECDITVDGTEALEAFLISWDEGNPYDLICLDIMMPKMDGVKTLEAIRRIENDTKKTKRAKIIMITALTSTQFVENAFDSGCEAYASKPLDTEKLIEVLKKLNLLEIGV
jgi:two-component system, chemotaxis family, chemotaxis protein CheY